MRPFDQMSNRDAAMFISKGGKLERPERCTREMWQVIDKCFEFDSEDRPTFQELHSLLIRIVEPHSDRSDDYSVCE